MVEIKRTPSKRRQQMADHFTEQVARKEALRQRGLRHKGETVWFGLGMMGIVGWAVAIPTLVFIAIGLWIDRTWPSQYSWALMFLIVGVLVGCLNAAYWVRKVRSKIIEEDKDDEQKS
jgi:ATP synthase protein I